MKNWLIRPITFLTALVLGLGFVFVATKLLRPLDRLEVSEAVLVSDPEIFPLRPPESDDWSQDDDSIYSIKLLETGDGFHGDEISARTGEEWLGLFASSTGFELRKTRLRVRRAYDAVVDNPGTMTGKSISVSDQVEPLFLVRNADRLRAGPVTTLRAAKEKWEFQEDLQLKKGFAETYVLEGKEYKLQVTGTADDPLLVLESDGYREIIFHVQQIGDATWNLIWVGDLDGDGKLDIYADLPTFYNFSQRRLFLSSEADPGKLVKQVALFHTSGC